MQDKELDDLFRDKFEEAEMTPSRDLWAAIESGLETKTKKRILPVYWIAAAVSITALTLGLLFTPIGEKPGVETLVLKSKTGEVKQEINTDSNGLAEAHATVRATIEGKEALDKIGLKPVANKADVTLTARTKKVKDHNAVYAPEPTLMPLEDDNSKKDLVAMQPSGLNAHPLNTAIGVKQEKLTLAKEAALPAEEVVLASNNELPVVKDEVSNENAEAPSRGIRNMGDLVNYVVDKLDKREEKVLQFKTEDDNSSLVALNIGMFKFNQKKHK